MPEGAPTNAASEHTPLGRGSEFDMIRELEERWGKAARGLGDDAAVLDTPAGEQLVVTTTYTFGGAGSRAERSATAPR